GAAAGSAAERVAAVEAREEAVAGQAAGVIERGRGVAGGEPPRLVAREARPGGGARGPAGRGGDAEADLGVIRAQTIRAERGELRAGAPRAGPPEECVVGVGARAAGAAAAAAAAEARRALLRGVQHRGGALAAITAGRLGAQRAG